MDTAVYIFMYYIYVYVYTYIGTLVPTHKEFVHQFCDGLGLLYGTTEVDFYDSTIFFFYYYYYTNCEAHLSNFYEMENCAT